jgi:pilus assembly protein Flp/PilA
MNGRKEAQGLVEYALILVLVAIVVIAVLVLLGPAIGNVFSQIVNNLTDSGGVADAAWSVASTESSAQQSPQAWDNAKEKIIVLWEEAEAQEEGLAEGVDFTVEALGEGLEVLVEFADENQDPVLYESLSPLLQQVRDGNLEAVPDVIYSLLDQLAEMPSDIGTAMSQKVAPRLIDACIAASGGTVSTDTITAALQAVEQLDDDHPGKAEALSLLQAAAETIDGRNDAIEVYLDGASTSLDLIIAGLELAGEEELAAEIATASEACRH